MKAGNEFMHYLKINDFAGHTKEEDDVVVIHEN